MGIGHSRQSLACLSLALLAALGAVLPYALADPAAARAEPASFPFGVWENAKHSVRVRVTPCGANACGRVIWASEKAKADAREGGTHNLIGQQLFQDLAPDGDGAWRGKIFVPDMNGVFDGTVQVEGPGRLVAEGCVVGNLICKSQAWTRVGR